MRRYFTHFLSLLLLVVVTAYVGMFSFVIMVANTQDEFAHSSRELESKIAGLEREYFILLEAKSHDTIEESGFVLPTEVSFIAEEGFEGEVSVHR
jgi:uncharacterized protein (UPF0333 family)